MVGSIQKERRAFPHGKSAAAAAAGAFRHLSQQPLLHINGLCRDNLDDADDDVLTQLDAIFTLKFG
jgi:hypothetical protein